MSGDTILGMCLILFLSLLGGAGLGSYLLKFTERKLLKRRADLTSAFLMVAVLIAFAASNFMAALVALGLSTFCAGIGIADSPPQED